MNLLHRQRTLAMMTGFERYTKKTRRAMFLEEMEQVVPWGKMCALIEPHYPKPGNGRRPKELEKMLRIYFLQQWSIWRTRRWKRRYTTRRRCGSLRGLTWERSPYRTKRRCASSVICWKNTIWENRFWAQ